MRVKRGPHRKNRRKGVLKEASGYFGMKSTSYRIAKQAVDKSGVYAYVGRKQKKRDMRSLWIVRINAACRMRDIRYSEFIHGLQLAMVALDRKSLSEIAIHDPAAFDKLVEIARQAVAAGAKK